MGQRVNLQYTIDIDDLPEETRNLVVKAYMPLKEATECLDDLRECKDLLSTDALNCVDNARQNLMNVDYALQDVQNIIKGYLAHVSGVNEPEQHQQTLDSMYGTQSNINMDDLEARLNNFKETFNTIENIDNEEPNQKQST